MALRTRPALGLVQKDEKPTAPAAPRRESLAKAVAREGKVQLSGYIPVDFKRQLDIHAAREGITIQSIVEEMHDLYAAAHGLTPIGGRQGAERMSGSTADRTVTIGNERTKLLANAYFRRRPVRLTWS